MLDTVRQAWRHLGEHQTAFEDRNKIYKQELASCNQQMAEGELPYSRTDFDGYSLEHFRTLTTNLIEAEEMHKKAELEAKDSGPRSNQFDI